MKHMKRSEMNIHIIKWPHPSKMYETDEKLL